METVLITGGTGLIGSALANALVEKNYKVNVLSRKSRADKNNISYALWNVKKGLIEAKAIESADHIIHLAGANVADKRWTSKRKKEIENSRVRSGDLIVKALEEIPNRVQTVVASSAIGWYGADDDKVRRKFFETDPPAEDFLGSTSVKWEAAIQPVEALGKRLVILRTGIVLSRKGGAYKEFRKPAQFRLVPVLGSGHQVISWIHIKDLVRLYITAIESRNLSGIYNAVAPEPVTNGVLMNTIGAAIGRKFISIKVPSVILKTALGEMSIEVLKSATVSSAKIESTGFQFEYPTIQKAVDALESKQPF